MKCHPERSEGSGIAGNKGIALLKVTIEEPFQILHSVQNDILTKRGLKQVHTPLSP